MDVNGIETGDEFKRNIVTAIKESEVFLFFSSAASNASLWTVKEVNVAVMLQKSIIPIKLDSAMYDDSILFDLAGLDFIMCNDIGGFSDEIDKLLRSLRKTINRESLSQIESYRMKAELGDVESQFRLGESYDNGDGVSEDESEAIKWYSKAAEQGHVEA